MALAARLLRERAGQVRLPRSRGARDEDVQVFTFVLQYGWAVLGAAIGPLLAAFVLWFFLRLIPGTSFPEMIHIYSIFSMR